MGFGKRLVKVHIAVSGLAGPADPSSTAAEAANVRITGETDVKTRSNCLHHALILSD